MSHGTVSPESILRVAETGRAGGGVNHREQKSIVARELVSDSRVLMEHAQLLVRNSNSRIERVEKRLHRLIAPIEAAATSGPAGKRLSARIARWLDRREAA